MQTQLTPEASKIIEEMFLHIENNLLYNKGLKNGIEYALTSPELLQAQNLCCNEWVSCEDCNGTGKIVESKEEKKYPIGGFAPGNYSCTCCICKQVFIGDKRAVQCEPCAEKMVDEALLEEKKETEDELWKEVIEMVRKNGYPDFFLSSHYTITRKPNTNE